MISIIITAYNYERFVAKCIESCLGQKGYDDFEVILIDDGSTDATLEIARKYAPRLRVESLENGGVERASNRGIELARGKFCVRVDADDFLYPDYLAALAPYLHEPDWAFLYPDYDCVDGNSTVIRHVKLPPFDVAEIKQRGDFLATGTLYRKSALEQIGLYNTQTPNCGLENYEVILKLLSNGGKGRHVDKALFAYRIHDKNMSLTRRENIIHYGSGIASRFGLPEYTTNENHPYGLKL